MRAYLRFSCLTALALLVFVASEAQAGCPVPPVAGPLPPITKNAASIDCTYPPPPPPPPPPPTNTWQNNGIISMNINEYGFPMISNLSVLGNGVMLFDNAGAGLQMDARSSLGNAYNPTQAGDCAQNPSKLLALDTSWGGNGAGIPASYGIQWTVQPRNYNEPSTCLGAGALLPYEFDFAATLGDGVHLPKEGMIIDMFVTRLSGSQTLSRPNSELAFFPLTYYFSLAYWSPDGVNFFPFNAYNGTNNTANWPWNVNYGVSAKAIMLCGTFNNTCLALYSNEVTEMRFKHASGARWNMTAMACSWIGNGFITDFSRHTGVRILAVGNPQTIISVIASAKAHISNWGDL